MAESRLAGVVGEDGLTASAVDWAATFNGEGLDGVLLLPYCQGRMPVSDVVARTSEEGVAQIGWLRGDGRREVMAAHDPADVEPMERLIGMLSLPGGLLVAEVNADGVCLRSNEVEVTCGGQAWRPIV